MKFKLFEICILTIINFLNWSQQNVLPENRNIDSSKPNNLLNNAQLITLFNRQYQRQPYWYTSPSQSSVYPPSGGFGDSVFGPGFLPNNGIMSNFNPGGIGSGLSMFNNFDNYPQNFFESFSQQQPTMNQPKVSRTRVEKKQNLQQNQKSENCGVVKPKIGNFVHKGQPTEHHTWPWHVQLTISGNDAGESETYCGGTLVAKNLILTAAHCYDDLHATKRAKNTQISFKGVGNINQKQFAPRTIFPNIQSNPNTENHLKMRALFVHIHPKYVPALSEYDAKLKGVTPGPVFDLALIEIQHDSQEVYDSLMPICLPNDNYQVLLGTKCKIMGHGFMNAADEDNFVMPSVLQMADVTISSNQACRDEVESDSIKSKITENTLCIRGPIHPCVGDSGGPLLCTGRSPNKIDGDSSFFNGRNKNDFYDDDDDAEYNKKWYLMGVTSFAVSTDSNDKCGQFKSAVFGKVSHVRDWIRSFTQQ